MLVYEIGLLVVLPVIGVLVMFYLFRKNYRLTTNIEKASMHYQTLFNSLNTLVIDIDLQEFVSEIVQKHQETTKYRDALLCIKVNNINDFGMMLLHTKIQRCHDNFYEELGKYLDVIDYMNIIDQLIESIRYKKEFTVETKFKLHHEKSVREIDVLLGCPSFKTLIEFTHVPFHIIDITDKKQEELRQIKKIELDALTHILNKEAFMKHIQETIDERIKYTPCLPIVMFFINLDRFKSVNDTLGYDAGDIMLQRTAQRLKSQVRKTDIIGRMGGDEFCVGIICQNVIRRERFETLADEIIKELSEPFKIDNQQVFVGCSIGIAEFPKNAKTVEDLIRLADEAMYEAKKEGGGCFFYSNEDSINTAG